MSEYTNYKVPDLRKLLTERGLPQAGNKAELIARLEENDKASNAPAEAKSEEVKKPEENNGDEITYSDDEAPAAKPVASEPAPAKEAAAPAPATEGAPAQDASAPSDKPAEGEAAASTEPKPEPVSYAAGLADTTAADEAKKRADRAKRFGIEETDEEAKKKSERAERFGQDDKEIVGGLDSALPERPLKRGRGRDVENGRPGKRQSRDRRGGRGGGAPPGRRGGRGGQGGQQQQQQPRKSGILDDPEQKAKAEARKARFATN